MDTEKGYEEELKYVYKDGYDNGYDNGRDEGYSDGQRDGMEEALEMAFEIIYTLGHKNGWIKRNIQLEEADYDSVCKECREAERAEQETVKDNDDGTCRLELKYSWRLKLRGTTTTTKSC